MTGFAYQWLRGSTPISGATRAEYTPTTSDHASRLACRVTATNLATARGIAKPAVAASASTEPVVLGPPVPTGKPFPSMTRLDPFGLDIGPVPPTVAVTASKLRCNTGVWTDAFSFGYQWLRNGRDIPGAMGQIYKVQDKDLGASISCVVRGHNPAGTASASSASSGPVRQGGGMIL